MHFARAVQPLQDLKNEASKLVGSLKSSDLKRVNLVDTGMWKPVHEVAWDATIAQICDRAGFPVLSACGVLGRLRHRLGHAGRAISARAACPPHHRACTVVRSLAARPTGVHGPRKGTRWLTLRLHGDAFSVYTDHRNLLSPESVNIGESSQAASCIARWVLLLSGYRFSIQHIAGEQNAFADGIEGAATWLAAVQTIKRDKTLRLTCCMRQRETAPTGAQAAAAHNNGVNWVEAYWDKRQNQVVNINVEGHRVGAGGVRFAGQPTELDYERERLIQKENT